MFTSICIVAAALGGADSASWPLYIETAGQDVFWESPSEVRPDGATYDLEFEVTGVSVLVSYFGIEFGPIDVSDQLPSTTFGGLFDGPCPIGGGTESVVEPPPPDPVTIAFDVSFGLDAEGSGDLAMTNIVLGTATTDIPIFGEVTVQLVELYLNGTMNVEVIGSNCPTDIDGDGSTNVNDILELIGEYGMSGSDADVDGDGIVGVNDILLVIEAWGPCA
ncbi:MAG: hypothetical protein MK116_04495 [Phycisphaerales bacterium]|nr:hypothetical protein [Phycisphaerales bacterium]